MGNLEGLENALRSFLDNEEVTSPIALVLEYSSCGLPAKTSVSYREIERLLLGRSEESIKRILTWAAQWRLIIPSWRRNFRSLCWGDRMEISTKPEVKYEVPLVVQYLVNRAVSTGLWDIEEAVKGVFRAVTNLDGDLAVRITKRMAEEVREDFREEAEGEFLYYFIPIDHLREIFDDFGLTSRKDTDLWVVEFKATDVISPEPNMVLGMWGAEFGFELNPSLCVKLRKLGSDLKQNDDPVCRF